MVGCVSVVVPTFRRPAFLAEAVESALRQPETLEVLVVDDSPEGSACETAAALGVRYLKMDVPSGGKPALPRNAGARLAGGRYLHFLDDDDVVLDGAYGHLAGALERDPGVGVAFGVVVPFGDERALPHERTYFADAARRAARAIRLGSQRAIVTTMLHQPTVLVNSACLIRRHLVELVGGYRAEAAPVEDVDFYLRAIRQFGCAFVAKPVLHYRVGHPSLMHSERQAERTCAAYAHIGTLYKQTWGVLEYRLLQLLAHTLLRA